MVTDAVTLAAGKVVECGVTNALFIATCAAGSTCHYAMFSVLVRVGGCPTRVSAARVLFPLLHAPSRPRPLPRLVPCSAGAAHIRRMADTTTGAGAGAGAGSADSATGIHGGSGVFDEIGGAQDSGFTDAWHGEVDSDGFADWSSLSSGSSDAVLLFPGERAATVASDLHTGGEGDLAPHQVGSLAAYAAGRVARGHVRFLIRRMTHLWRCCKPEIN